MTGEIDFSDYREAIGICRRNALSQAVPVIVQSVKRSPEGLALIVHFTMGGGRRTLPGNVEDDWSAWLETETGEVYSWGVSEVSRSESKITLVRSADADGEGSGPPKLEPGTELTLQPPDYLAALDDFAAKLETDPDVRRRAERFLGLRAALAGTGGTAESAGPGALTEGEVERFGESLLPAQKAALRNAFERRISFVWGPPGTGKTRTIGQIAAAFREKGKKILVVATTNSATDVTTFAIDDACAKLGAPLKDGELIRYTKHLTDPKEYGRRPHLMKYSQELQKLAEEEEDLLKRITLENKALERAKKRGGAGSRRAAPGPGQTEMAFPEEEKEKGEEGKTGEGDGGGGTDEEKSPEEIDGVIADLKIRHKRIGERRREIVKGLLFQAGIVTATVVQTNFARLLESYAFDALILDEASIVPLAQCVYFLAASGVPPAVVISGDPRQLCPIVPNGLDEYHVSVARWFKRNIYGHLRFEEGGEMVRAMEGNRYLSFLDVQFRMRPEIREIVNAPFYEGRLKDGEPLPDPPAWAPASGLPLPAAAVVDVPDVPVPARRPFFSSSSDKNTNYASFMLVRDILGRMDNRRFEGPAEERLKILILTPFRNQWKAYNQWLQASRAQFRRLDLLAATVHKAQGKEADVVLFDLVDPCAWFIDDDNGKARQIWCVACSRARRQLLFVASSEKLGLARGLSRKMLRGLPIVSVG